MKTAEAHLVQYIDRVVDVPVDKEPGEAALSAEDSGCCTKCYSDVEAIIDIRPDSVVKRRQLKTSRTRVIQLSACLVPVARGYVWNPSTLLSGTCVPQTSQTRVSRSITKD